MNIFTDLLIRVYLKNRPSVLFVLVYCFKSWVWGVPFFAINAGCHICCSSALNVDKNHLPICIGRWRTLSLTRGNSPQNCLSHFSGFTNSGKWDTGYYKILSGKLSPCSWIFFFFGPFLYCICTLTHNFAFIMIVVQLLIFIFDLLLTLVWFLKFFLIPFSEKSY